MFSNIYFNLYFEIKNQGNSPEAMKLATDIEEGLNALQDLVDRAIEVEAQSSEFHFYYSLFKLTFSLSLISL